MEIKKGDYVVGIWFADKPDECNFQLTILKRDGKWLGEYRFRYYVDHQVFGSTDKKSWYTVTPPDDATEEKVIEVGNEMLKGLKDKMGFEFTEYVEVKGDFDKMLFKAGQTDWFHIKKINKDDKEGMKQLKKDNPGANLDGFGDDLRERRTNVLREKQNPKAD